MSHDSQNAAHLHCPQCGYSLAGLPDDHHCPECGFGYQRDAITALVRGDGHTRLSHAESVLWFSVAALLIGINALLFSDEPLRWHALWIRGIPIVAIAAAWFYRRNTEYEFEFTASRVWIMALGWPLLVAVLLTAPLAALYVAMGLAILAMLIQQTYQPRFPFLERSTTPDLAAEIVRIRRLGLGCFVAAFWCSLIGILRR